jgi:hypothetical protein
VPPLEPGHIQFHGPLPATVEAVPTLQRFVVGVLLTAVPFAEPHEPLTGPTATGAWHAAVVPPLVPGHIQFHGPAPLTAEAVPALHRFIVGVLLAAAPFAVPQAPFVGVLETVA